VFSPEAVSTLDEPEDRVRIHIIGERNTPGKESLLERKNVLPGGFLLHELVIEKESTIII